MDLTNIVLSIFEAFVKAYSIIFTKPYATVNAQYKPQRDNSGKATNNLMALTIINESFGDIDVQRFWFLTSYNRLVPSKSVDAKLPVKVLENDRVSYLVPVDELKAALNKRVGETVIKAVIYDKNDHKFDGRVDKVTQKALAE